MKNINILSIIEAYKKLDKNLFQKFFRANVKKETSGIGLGLYIAKNIVERHGGQIWATSEEGRGSIFYFTLPFEAQYLPPQI